MFHLPRRIGPHVVAANGHAAIRCTKGHWMDSDYGGANDAYVLRFSKLPWNRVLDPESPHWKDLDSVRMSIYRNSPIAVFGKDHRLAPSPSVRIGTSSAVPLSVLQIVARLPRVEVYAYAQATRDPVFFRFTGGEGIIAFHDLKSVPFTIHKPHRDFEGNHITYRQNFNFGTKPPEEPQLENWPPYPELGFID